MTTFLNEKIKTTLFFGLRHKTDSRDFVIPRYEADEINILSYMGLLMRSRDCS